ncbi:NAD(+) kinase [Candidatus Bathyarchaeota archaeon]|nr:NAD(+) kinase [Candidatus Bathyarchaeota archaeon]
MLKTAGLVARFDEKAAIELVQDLARYLKDKGLKVYIEDTLAKKIDTDENCVPLSRMKTGLVITIGGDGTILRTCVSIPKPEPPLLAINIGVRGFLTEVEPEHAFEAVDKCLNDDFNLEKCMKLAITSQDIRFPDALNEVLITADEPAKLLYTRIKKDRDRILNCQADGLMVATQTGSTGYSLSAGGPVLDPNVDAFVLTPVCALTVFRSIVFPADSSLTVEVLRPRKVLVVIDGQYRKLLDSDRASITITRSTNVTSFVRFRENFYRRLRDRLLFKGLRGEI